MPLTPDALKAIFPTCPDPEVQAPAYEAAFLRWAMDSKEARAGAFAIVGNETGGTLSPKAETSYFNTPWSRVAQVFSGVIGLNEQVYNGYKRLGRAGFDKAFFGHVYDDRRRPKAYQIGGNVQDGDGYKFRGVGPIQLTGRDNVTACAADHGMAVDDFLARIVVDPMLAASSAVWFLVKRARLLPLLNSASEADFLKAAAVVGVGDGANTRARRLAYRRQALSVLGLVEATKITATGNVVIKDIDRSTIIRDSNKGLSVTTLVGGMGAAAPVITSVSGMDWRLAAVLSVAILVAAAGTAYYLLRVKKARRQMHAAGIV